jgi:hypothetical protein
MPEDQLNIDEIMTLMRDSNKSFDSDIFIPSINKEIHVKPMNALHLKNIIKTTLNGVFVDNQFNIVLYSIFREILDPSISLAHINVFDKVAILLELRKKNVKDTIDVELLNGDSATVESVKIDKILAKIKKYTAFSDEDILDGPYKITLNYPTLEEEYLFELDFDRNKIKKTNENDKTSMKEIPGAMFIYYLTQYIKEIYSGDKFINLRTRSPQERLAIVETLPGNTINKIIDKIDTVFGHGLNRILTVEKTIDDVTYSGRISLNPTLFT